MRNNNTLANSSTGRSLTSVNTSWGTETVVDHSITGAPAGSVDADIHWNFSGTLPGAGLGDNEADLRIGFGDGGTGSGRWTNYITLTPEQASGAPTFESLGISDTTACREYYDLKLSEWVSPFQFYVYGPLNGYNVGGANGGVAIAPGTEIDSRQTGNFSTGGTASQNGIW